MFHRKSTWNKFGWTSSPFMFKKWNLWSVCHHIACLVFKLDCLLIWENKIKSINLSFKKFLFLFMLKMFILNVAARLWWDLSEVNRYGPSSYKQALIFRLKLSHAADSSKIFFSFFDFWSSHHFISFFRNVFFWLFWKMFFIHFLPL